MSVFLVTFIFHFVISTNDIYGIEQIYKTTSGGLDYTPNWTNKDRTFTAVGVDPNSNNQLCYARGSSSTFTVSSSDGTLSMSGNTPRYYCYLNHKNVEITVYAQRGNEAGTVSYQGFAIVGRSNHKDYSSNKCQARGYYLRYYNSGKICLIKEFIHHSSCLIYSYSKNNPCVSVDDTIKGKWYGLKFVIQNINSNSVKLEGYLDITNGINGGNWNKIVEYTDNGNWIAEYSSDEKYCMTDCGYNDGQVWVDESNSIFLRTDKVDGYKWKWFTVREISPFVLSDSDTKTTTTTTKVKTTTTTIKPSQSGSGSIDNSITLNLKSSSSVWWLAIYVKNVCGGIKNVEIKDSGNYVNWKSYNSVSSYYAFKHDGNKFTFPLLVRITNNDGHQYTTEISELNSDVIDTGFNFCDTQAVMSEGEKSGNVGVFEFDKYQTKNWFILVGIIVAVLLIVGLVIFLVCKKSKTKYDQTNYEQMEMENV